MIKSLVIAIFIGHSAVAQSSLDDHTLKSKAAQQAAEQLKRIINDKLQQIVALELAAGVDIDDIDYGLKQVEKSSHERFGVLFSANNKGLILSVTPNSPASHLGLISGDVIINVNNTSLSNHSFAALIKQHYVTHDNPVSIKLKRDGRVQYVSGKLSSLMTPAWTLAMEKITITEPVQKVIGLQASSEQCGRIVVGKYMPRKEGDFVDMRSVIIKEIDGVKQRFSASARGSVVGLSAATSTSHKTRFKLPTGTHKIMVSPRLAYSPEKSSINYSNIRFSEEHEFTIDIAANTTYYLVYDTRKESSFAKTHIPVIWQTKSQKCQLS